MTFVMKYDWARAFPIALDLFVQGLSGSAIQDELAQRGISIPASAIQSYLAYQCTPEQKLLRDARLQTLGRKMAKRVERRLAKFGIRDCRVCLDTFNPRRRKDTTCRKCTKEDVRRFERYGIRPAEFQLLWRSQGHRCAICRVEIGPDAHAIDHNHETGQVRGLLCYRCNFGVGHLDLGPGWLRAAMHYLGRECELKESK